MTGAITPYQNHSVLKDEVICDLTSHAMEIHRGFEDNSAPRHYVEMGSRSSARDCVSAYHALPFRTTFARKFRAVEPKNGQYLPLLQNISNAKYIQSIIL
jgi:hypothetical protein